MHHTERVPDLVQLRIDEGLRLNKVECGFLVQHAVGHETLLDDLEQRQVALLEVLLREVHMASTRTAAQEVLLRVVKTPQVFIEVARHTFGRDQLLLAVGVDTETESLLHFVGHRVGVEATLFESLHLCLARVVQRFAAVHNLAEALALAVEILLQSDFLEPVEVELRTTGEAGKRTLFWNALVNRDAIAEVDRLQQAGLHLEHVEGATRQPAGGSAVEVRRRRNDLTGQRVDVRGAKTER